MLRKILIWIKSLYDRSCPECGKYSSVYTSSRAIDRVFYRLSKEHCTNKYHDKLVQSLNEKMETENDCDNRI